MRKGITIRGIVLLAISLLFYGTYQLMNARNYQLFGGLTSQVETKEKIIALTFDDGPAIQSFFFKIINQEGKNRKNA